MSDTTIQNNLENDLDTLRVNAPIWAASSIEDRINLLNKIKDMTMSVAKDWVADATKQKQINQDSHLVGEEWLSGPYALLNACNLLMTTLNQLENKSFLKSLKVRKTHKNKLAIKVLPHNIWERLLLNGIKSEVWLQEMVNTSNLDKYTAANYDAVNLKQARVSLVLGAGNISSIAPLDCFHKLFVENSVVILKMNPINDYLAKHLSTALSPLIELGVLRIVTGDGHVGATLCKHVKVDEIHITGSKKTHDTIVWGEDPTEATRLKQLNTPVNEKRITSELGGVGPTIITPGKWTSADLKFQAQQVATQKLHNNGFNCVASQFLMISSQWKQRDDFMYELRHALSNAQERGLYYPKSENNMNDLAERFSSIEVLATTNNGKPARLLIHPKTTEEIEYATTCEVFAPALFIKEVDESDPLTFLQNCISYSNNQLSGTLGANIIIDPKTRRKISKNWDQLIDSLHYGSIAINTWTGVAFLSPQSSWGAYPGETLNNIQSGIGVVHNTFMFSKVERTVTEAPFRPYPRNVLHGQFGLLPKPPWFITNKSSKRIGELLTNFQYKPSWLKIPMIFFYALKG